jgi:hypothetical protein
MTAAGIHKDLLFIVRKRQLSKDFPIQEKVLAIPTVAGGENKECTAPTAGRIQKHFAAFPAYQLMKNFFKAMDQTGPVLGSLLRNSQESVL